MTPLRSKLEQNLGWIALALLFAGCLCVMRPFVSALLWAVVLSFSSWPLIAFIAWLVKAGAIINFISESVMVGFKCGVALFLASTQLPKLFGIHGEHGNFWVNSRYFLQHLHETNPTSLTIGGAALAVLVLGKIFLKNKPVALFVVVVLFFSHLLAALPQPVLADAVEAFQKESTNQIKP